MVTCVPYKAAAPCHTHACLAALQGRAGPTPGLALSDAATEGLTESLADALGAGLGSALAAGLLEGLPLVAVRGGQGPAAPHAK